MNKYLIGVMVEATPKGEIKPACIKRDIVKETLKMLYIDDVEMVFSCKTHIHKSSCGQMDREVYSTSFRFRIYKPANDENLAEVVTELSDRVSNMVREELRRRIDLLGKWTDIANSGDLFTGDN